MMRNKLCDQYIITLETKGARSRLVQRETAAPSLALAVFFAVVASNYGWRENLTIFRFSDQRAGSNYAIASSALPCLHLCCCRNPASRRSFSAAPYRVRISESTLKISATALSPAPSIQERLQLE